MKFFSLLVFNLLLIVTNSWATGAPVEWQMGFQEPVAPLAHKAQGLHDFIMYFVWGISAFVLLLLAVTCIKFSAKNNPTPSTTSHNTLLEIIWIAIPVAILTIIMIPSVKFIAFQEKAPETEMTLKVIGRQWYWSYEYPDHNNIYFDSYMKKDGDLGPNEPRLLATDNKIILPVETYIKVQITASDVIHSWAVPSLGGKNGCYPR